MKFGDIARRIVSRSQRTERSRTSIGATVDKSHEAIDDHGAGCSGLRQQAYTVVVRTQISRAQLSFFEVTKVTPRKVFCLHRGFRGNISLSSKRPHLLCEVRARA